MEPESSPRGTPKESQKQVPVQPYFLRVPGLFLGLGNGPRWDSHAFWTPKPRVLSQPPGAIFRPESGSLFGHIFFEVLGVFQGLLGAVLGFPRLSWEASGPQKPEKICVLRFLQMQLFGSLKLLMALLVPSWRLPVPTWSQNESPKFPQK